MRRVEASGHLFVLDRAKHRSVNRSHHSFTSVPYVGGKKVPNARQAFLYVSTDSISGGECSRSGAPSGAICSSEGPTDRGVQSGVTPVSRLKSTSANDSITRCVTTKFTP